MARPMFHQPLSQTAMTELMTTLMSGAMPPEEIAEFLTAIAARGETAEEIAVAVQVVRRHAVPLPLSKPYELCDTCGTGGDGQGTINVSTLAALVVAAAGLRVAKHGNRAASSRCGSADVLEVLGLNLEAAPTQVARSIEEVGFGFCFAPRFHPAMNVVAPIRKTLKIRTIFNLIGPLANPAPLTFQLVGVSEARLMQPVAEALSRLGVRRGMVVRGLDGFDEVTTSAPTEFVEVYTGRMTSGRLEPDALGVPPAAPEQLRGGDVTENARVAREILRGEPSPRQDFVAVNAGCALYLAGRASTVRDGVSVARRVLGSGEALTLLERVNTLSRDAA